MSSKPPDIPTWAARQIEDGLVKDKLIVRESDKSREMTSVEIRTSLNLLKLDALRRFFHGIADSKTERPNTAYEISMYQTALIHIGAWDLVIDGVYKDSKMPKSNTEEMIAKFQEQNNIAKDGIPGRQTATKIVEALDRMIALLPKAIEPKPIQKLIPKPTEKNVAPLIPSEKIKIIFPGVPELQVGSSSKSLSFSAWSLSPTSLNPSPGVPVFASPTKEDERQAIIDWLTGKNTRPGFMQGIRDGWNSR